MAHGHRPDRRVLVHVAGAAGVARHAGALSPRAPAVNADADRCLAAAGSQAGWQFMQRGFMITFAASLNSARERAGRVGDAGECRGLVADRDCLRAAVRGGDDDRAGGITARKSAAPKAHRDASSSSTPRSAFNIPDEEKLHAAGGRRGSLDRPKPSLYNRARSAPAPREVLAGRLRRPGSSVGRALH